MIAMVVKSLAVLEWSISNRRNSFLFGRDFFFVSDYILNGDTALSVNMHSEGKKTGIAATFMGKRKCCSG